MAKTEPQVETVAMEDGRKVEFVGEKKKLIKESQVGAKGELQVRLDFRNGVTRLFTIPEALITKFALHGAEQKLGDAIAGVTDIDDAVLGIDELVDQLYNGEWNSRRESNGLAGTSVLLKALVEVTGKPVDVLKAFLASKTHAEKLALRNSPKFKPTVERLEAEKQSRAKSTVNVDALLGELEGDATADESAPM